VAEFSLVVVALFIILTVVTVVPIAPLGLSVSAYLILVHINLTGSDFTPATSIGVLNTIKVIVLPTVLLLRARLTGRKFVSKMAISSLWFFFIAYVAIASFWTPFPIPALKQVGYLYAYTMLFSLFAYLYGRDKASTYKVLSWSTLVALGFTLMAYFGGITQRSNRLTSLVAPQSFGLYLALMAGVILAFPRRYVREGVPRIILIPVMLLMLLFNGSRTGLAIVTFILAFREILLALLGRFSYKRTLIALSGCILMISILLIGINFPQMTRSLLTSSRSLQPIAVLVYPDYSLEDIGTARFRSNMYQLVLNGWREKGNRLFGNGTSSAGDFIARGYISYRGYSEYTVDANRTVHNEYLRALYEWGILGLLLLCCIVIGFVYVGIRAMKCERSQEACTLTASVIGLVGIALTFGNLLAAAGSPLGIAATALLAQLFTLKGDAMGRRFNSQVWS